MLVKACLICERLVKTYLEEMWKMQINPWHIAPKNAQYLLVILLPDDSKTPKLTWAPDGVGTYKEMLLAFVRLQDFIARTKNISLRSEALLRSYSKSLLGQLDTASLLPSKSQQPE